MNPTQGRMRVPGARLRGLAAGLLAIASPLAAAQSDDDLFELDLFALEEVVVKVSVASLFEEQELQVGSSTAVIKRKDWQRRGARRFTDAISNQPSVMILPTFGGTDAIAIRGFAQEVSVRGIATILDGVPLNTLAYGTSQYDKPDIGLGTLDRIEMIRGPGSAIYGSDAFHGVLALHSFDSKEDFSDVQGEIGSRGYQQASLRLSRGLTDAIRLNFAGAFSGQPDQNRKYDFTVPCWGATLAAPAACPGLPARPFAVRPDAGQQATSDRNHEYESHTAMLKLVVDPEGPWAWRTGIYYNRHDAHKFSDIAPHVSPTGAMELGEDDFSGSNSFFYMWNFSATRALPHDIETELSSFFWTNHHESRLENFNPILGVSRNKTFLGVDEDRRGIKLTFKQADNPWNTQWSTAIGWNRMEINDRREQYQQLTAAPCPANSTTAAPFCTFPTQLVTREILSFFLQAKTSLFEDKLHLLYGGRIDHYHDHGLNTVKTPRLGMIYQPMRDTAFKLLYGNSFRAPVATELTSLQLVAGNPNIDPETIDSYEFVIQRQREHWKAEFVWFYSRWKDRINTQSCVGQPQCFPTTGFFQQYTNQGTNIARGIELILGWTGDQFRVDSSYSYVTSEDELQTIDYVAFPRHILNLGFGYTLKEHGIDIYVNNRVHYKAKEGKVFAPNFVRPPDLPHYWKVDLNVTKKVSPDLEFFVNFRNLFDRDNFHPSIWNNEGGIPDEQFNVSAGVRFKI